MKNHINKFIERRIEARHQKFKLIEEAMWYFSRKKTQKLIEKKQQEISWAMNSGYGVRDKEKEYVTKLLTSNEPDGSLLYDWDKKDAAGVENGWYKFSRIGESTNYKSNIRKPELTLYERNSDSISHTILHEQPERIIDMGGGDGKETIQILSLLQKEAIANVTMTTKEISPYLGEAYKENIEKRSAEHRVPLKTSFMYENFFENKELKSNKDSRIFLFPGGTIGNFNDDLINQIKYTMTPEKITWRRSIFMTFFVAPDKTQESYEDQILKLKATYGDPDRNNPYFDASTHDAIKDWVMSGIYHWLGESVKDKLEFAVTYEEQGEKWGRVLIGARVKEDFTLKVGNDVFEKKAGDRIWGIQSRRFSLPYFKTLIETGWYKMRLCDTEQWVALTHIETPALHLDNMSAETARNWKRTGQIFALILLLGWGYQLIDIAKEKKEKEQKQKEWAKAVDKEWWHHGGYDRRLSGESAEALLSSWDLIYKPVFTEIYGIQDTDKIKFDFLSWYVQEKSEWNYKSWQHNYDETRTIKIIEDYIAKDGMRLKFDKNIVFSAHAELRDKEDILLSTLHETKDMVVPWGMIESNAAAKYSTQQYYAPKTYDIYMTRWGKPYAYVIEEKNGKKYIFAKEKYSNQDSFSLAQAKHIVLDYFTPPHMEKAVKKINEVLDKHYIVEHNQHIEDTLIQLSIQGYHIDYYGLLKPSYEDINIKYFIETFLADRHYKKKDSLDHPWVQDLRSSIEPLIKEICFFDPSIAHKTAYKNDLRSKMFNLMIKESYPGFMQYDAKTLNTRAMKNRLVENYDEIEPKPESGFRAKDNDNFPLRNDYIEPLSEWITSIDGFISEHGSTSVSEMDNTREFYKHGIYTTKSGDRFEWWFKLNGPNNKKFVARYIGNDPHFADKHKDFVLQKYVIKNHWARSEEAKKKLEDGRDEQKIRLGRQQIEIEVGQILWAPNTYFANLILEDWLNR